MFDQIILFIDHYLIWVALAIGFYKVLHIAFYKGLQARYIVSTYFVIFSGMRVSGVKDSNQRTRFRQMHNLLTICFYLLFVVWLVVHITVKSA